MRVREAAERAPPRHDQRQRHSLVPEGRDHRSRCRRVGDDREQHASPVSGTVDYIAQNGIQVSLGGSATVTGNTVSGNWYTPTSSTACGLLFYQADGVKQKSNNLFGNETNLCNVGRGGGNASL